MPASVPRNGYSPLLRFGFNLFYLKSWVCPPDTFFNISNNLCESCSIPNCQTCQYIDLCQTCLTGFYLKVTAAPSLQCVTCPVQFCT